MEAAYIQGKKKAHKPRICRLHKGLNPPHRGFELCVTLFRSLKNRVNSTNFERRKVCMRGCGPSADQNLIAYIDRRGSFIVLPRRLLIASSYFTVPLTTPFFTLYFFPLILTVPVYFLTLPFLT